MDVKHAPLICLFFSTIMAIVMPAAAVAEPQHAVAMHGDPKYPPGFAHFDYVNPQAPKGGRLVNGVLGSFDNLNPMIIRGNVAPGMREYVYESLLARAYDEPFTLYGLLAESLEVPEDRSWVQFELNPKAKFSDGQPVTIDDVIFSLELLREKGRPNHRSYYSKVEKIERIGERGIKLLFKPDGDREMPLIMGLMPILPKHKIDPENFESTTLTPPIGSGPYIVERVDGGSSLTFKRNPDHWGKDLPVNRGLYNFDEIRYDFYRDGNSLFEAFKKGLTLINSENDPGRWAREYNFPAVIEGNIVKEEFEIGTPAGMTGLAMNTRRLFFADIRVRQALNLLFDFEWANQNLYFGLYKRTESYFDRSELSSHGKAADELEKKILEPFPNAVIADAMSGALSQPKSDASGRSRANLRLALGLLRDAGYEQRDGMLIHKITGEVARFEMLAATSEQERLFLIFARQIKQLGIDVSIRLVDSAQYQARKTSFDFDIIQNFWPASLSPGNEQSYRWSSQAADAQGSFNYPGVRSDAADAMIAAMLAAKKREDFVSSVRALDRVLLSGTYVIPLFHLPKQWVAYWNQLEHPDVTPLYGVQIDSWWMKDAATD